MQIPYEQLSEDRKIELAREIMEEFSRNIDDAQEELDLIDQRLEDEFEMERQSYDA